MRAKWQNSRAWKWIVNICRFILGATFVFSGFVKAVDPLGTYYKIQDYLAAFGMQQLLPDIVPLLMSVLLAVLEFAVGMHLLLGIKRRFTTRLALLIMLVMTPLTLYLALTNPISDCGCFGDALVLTNWQTFGKNVVLLTCAIVLMITPWAMVRFLTKKMEWTLSNYCIVFALALAGYCLATLPIIDFRPYKIGNNIREGMEIPEGAKPTIFDTRFIMEKDGVKQTFTVDNYPDSTWTFVSAETVVVEKGYEPPIHDFVMESLETGEDITDEVLDDPGYTFLLIALFAVLSVSFLYASSYLFNHFKPYQQARIQVALGMKEDLSGVGYNVNQSKIAIGSGGLFGKGFLNGTQTKLKYVPEQDTDFIFCTIGEEQGFVGATCILTLFLLLILRLIVLSERQSSIFGLVYGYCVLSILLFHLFVNIGMVLGITPVIGIPLPFFSYGGSSLWGFTILLFIFLRIDAGRKDRNLNA